MKRLRVYVDTSVIGGCLDPEFEEPSRKLLDAAKAGALILLVSTITRRELQQAPAEVRRLLDELPAEVCKEV
jgi:predicted nucleic acid-binding protein